MQKILEESPCQFAYDDCKQQNYINVKDDVATQDLDFTLDNCRFSRNARPRRRTSILSGSAQSSSPKRNLGTKSLLSQKSNSEAFLTGEKEERENPAIFAVSAPRRRSRLLQERLPGNRFDNNGSCEDSNSSTTSQVFKKPRRRTIYIPSDDTTVFTIHPGQSGNNATFNHVNHAGLGQIAENDQAVGKRSSSGRRTSIAAAPKRPPLQQSSRPFQEQQHSQDIPGAGRGKENMIPGGDQVKGSDLPRSLVKKARRFSISGQNCPSAKEDISIDLRHSNIKETKTLQRPSANTRNPQAPKPNPPSHIDSKPICDTNTRVSIMKKRNSLYYGSSWTTSSRNVEPVAQTNGTGLGNDKLSSRKPVAAQANYPVLSETIEEPEMYEEAWLRDQESAIQQLVNRLFEEASDHLTKTRINQEDLRRELLQIYQGPELVLIHRRLQASSLYGALNPPKTSMGETSRLQNDLGLRRQFLSMWLDSYNLGPLMTVAEVVVGRSITIGPQVPTSNKNGNRDTANDSVSGKATKTFLESCLLGNKDASEDSDRTCPVWCWRRTVVRSLMLILLLDVAKEKGLISGNLFTTSSPFKSSNDVLVELLTLLAPFAGHRSLLHLSFRVQHIQLPLAEYEYQVKNLATDFRDGILLTYLVELLQRQHRQTIEGGTKQGQLLRSDDIPTDIFGNLDSFNLSQHLILPCPTALQKMTNVDIALQALRENAGLAGALDGINAEDIVNGHRERTVTLLWNVICMTNLELILDLDHIRQESNRLSRRSKLRVTMDDRSSREIPNAGANPSSRTRRTVSCTLLLEDWAWAVAAHHGLKMSNLTTSFSNGKIFGAIIDEYRPPSFKSSNSRSSCVANTRLSTKLKEIGCSNAFGKALLTLPLTEIILTWNLHSIHLRPHRTRPHL